MAEEGLDAMEAYMNEIGVAMSISVLGVTEEMISGIAAGSFILNSGYRILTKDEIETIL